MQAIDVLQAASNAVAGNVTGPVDILSLLLRKIGVPVPENALGSSQWAREHGLLRDVDDPYARAAGESLGIIAPMVAAAKAPQIARGLLQAGDNLAAPRTLNPQTGAIVWHGSPHKFDKFDSSKIGTGEGAQAYGHGLYLAESPDVARTYLGTGKAKLGPASEARLAKAMERAQDAGRYGEALALEELLINRSPARAISRFSDHSGGQQYKDALEAVQKYARYFDEGGNLYKADLPDTAIARMLDWDKPLSQQAPEAVRKFAGAKIVNGAPIPGGGKVKIISDPDFVAKYFIDYGDQQFRITEAELRNLMGSGVEGKSIYAEIAKQMGGDKGAADFLRAQGIPGIRYLDGGSRGAGAGTRNYVVFPGEEALLTILERNGIPLP